jgi:hypothetical protein
MIAEKRGWHRAITNFAIDARGAVEKQDITSN